MRMLHRLENGDLHFQVLNELLGLELQAYHRLDSNGLVRIIVHTLVDRGKGALPYLRSNGVGTDCLRHCVGGLVTT